jgi:predicted transposase YdaD
LFERYDRTMKRDSLFYRLFAQSPTLLFDLLPDRPLQAAAYRFDSVAVKEPKFEMVSKIMVYKFTNSSREEIAAMLGTNVEDIRALREAKEEAVQTIALNLLKENIPLETIARTTGLTVTQIRALQAQTEN